MLPQPTSVLDTDVDVRPRRGESIDDELRRLRELHDEVGRRILALERLETRRPAVVTVPATSGGGAHRREGVMRPQPVGPAEARAVRRAPASEGVRERPVPAPAAPAADVASRRALLLVELIVYAVVVLGLLAFFLT